MSIRNPVLPRDCPAVNMSDLASLALLSSPLVLTLAKQPNSHGPSCRFQSVYVFLNLMFRF